MRSFSFSCAAYCIFLAGYFLAGCAPKTIPPAAPVEGITVNDIIQKASDDIEVIKVIADISVEKNGELVDQAQASLLVKKEGWVHARIYKLGMLANDMVLKDGELFLLEGKGDIKTAIILNKLYRTIFWWDDMQGGALSQEGNEYIIRTGSNEIHLDSSSLLPLRQDILTLNKKISVTYRDPLDYGGLLYPSRIEIALGKTSYRIFIEKLLKNPVLGGYDFKVP